MPDTDPLLPRHGGRVLADQLHIQGVDTLFGVPGESFLALLDGLYEHRNAIKVVTTRQEGGASNMADAYGKLTGKVGVCAVTRGPGATNASIGVHTAFQDSTPFLPISGACPPSVYPLSSLELSGRRFLLTGSFSTAC